MAKPGSWRQWLDVAQERLADAYSMLDGREQSNGPVYMAGWAVECALGGLLAAKGIRRTRERGGHDLKRLWKDAGLRMHDLADPDGNKATLLERWETDLRYDPELKFPSSNSDIVEAAKKLTSYLIKQARRHGGKR